MQVAACESVTVVATTDVDPAFLAQERAIEMGKEDLQSKPENIREKIVEGRMAKRVNEVALLEQPFIKDTDQTVGEVVKAAVAKIGENIKVRRFVKYNLGEGLEKRTEDFAAEVAAATGQVAEPKAEVKTEVEAPEPKAEAEPEVAEAESTQAESSAEAKAPEASVAVEEKEETVAAPPAPKISAKDVQALRKQSGAGMMDCKKAFPAPLVIHCPVIFSLPAICPAHTSPYAPISYIRIILCGLHTLLVPNRLRLLPPVSPHVLPYPRHVPPVFVPRSMLQAIWGRYAVAGEYEQMDGGIRDE